jgi:Na+/alanine symporter
MSFPVLIANWANSQLWYAIPLIAAISLVYGATRHEKMVPILHHAWRTAKWIVGFMLIIIAILSVISWYC